MTEQNTHKVETAAPVTKTEAEETPKKKSGGIVMIGMFVGVVVLAGIVLFAIYGG